MSRKKTEKLMAATEKLDYTGQKMLAIFVDFSNEEPIIRFEEEDHFWLLHRRFINDRSFPADNLKDILNDYNWCWDLGFSVINGANFDRSSKFSCDSLVSVHKNEYEEWVIRIDEEDKGDPIERKLVHQIPIEPYTDDHPCQNDRLCYGVGQFIVKHLLSYEPSFLKN